MRNMGSKGPIRWRRVAVCASALLMFAVPSVCLAEEAPAVDEAAAIVTEVQEQTQTSVETPSEIPAETPAPDVPPAETEQTSTGGQSPEGEQAFKGDTAADHKQQAKPAPSTEAIPAATPSNSTEQNSSDSDANADTPSDGSDQQDKPLTGVQYVDGDWHYYDESGNPATGWYTWEDGARSYFEDGVAATDWTHIDGKTYYFVQDGEHGCLIWERRIDDKVYYFDGFGVMHTGWLTWKKDAIRSYFGADGAALSGWQTVGGKRYYFDPANWCHGYRWEHRIGGKVYYFDADCHMWTGWLTWKKDSTRSYFGADGAALSGWRNDGGKRHYIDPKTFRTVRWEHRIDGKVYYFDGFGVMHTGWLTWKKDSTRSYFGADGAALSGWQTVGGRRYYRWEKRIGGKVYYFDSDCHMWTGWLTWKKDGSRSYFGEDESGVNYGAALSKWRNDGEKRYYVDPETLRTLRWEQTIDGKPYYFDGDYSLVTMSWIQFKYDNCPTWADSEGLLTKVPGASLDSAGMLKGARPGWLFIGSDRFYIKPDGTPMTQWMTVGSNRYWFMKKTGVAAEGVVLIDGYRYFSPTTQAMETGWKTVGSHTYYFDPSTGKAATSSRKVDGKMHYFDTNGWEFTALQLKLIQAAKKTPTTPAGYCSEWISNVFRNAGIASFDGDACDQYKWYCRSSNRSELRVGMIVAVSKHSNTRLGRIYGHVCLYIGDGKIMDSIGRVRTMNLQPWLNHYGNMVTPKWGWGGDVALA